MYTKKIPIDEVVFHSLSFFDNNGRLFKWNGELYRAIPAGRSAFCRDIFDRGIVQELVKKQLFVETEITSLKLDDYEMVLRHRSIPFVSYPQEWCDAMLKDAALHHLNFCLELDRYDLVSQDAHPLNILFDGYRPIFVDFGSIDHRPIDRSFWSWWPPYDQFCRVFIYPLRLMSNGHGRIARWLLHDYEQGVLKSDVDALIHKSQSALNFAGRIVKLLRYATRRDMLLAFQPIAKKIYALGRRVLLGSSGSMLSGQAFWEQIRKEVTSINLHSLKPQIPDSGCGLLPSPLPPENWATKQQCVHAVLSDLQPSSVLDIGRGNNREYYSKLAARCGSQVVCFNPNEASVKRLYAHAKEKNLSILPLLMDITSPSYDFSNDWFVPACERLRCDMVMALDLIDQLVFEGELHFSTIVDRLSAFSRRWLLVEFIPREDIYVTRSWSGRKIRLSWYTVDSFINALRRRFHHVSIMPSYLESRVLLLCEK